MNTLFLLPFLVALVLAQPAPLVPLHFVPVYIHARPPLTTLNLVTVPTHCSGEWWNELHVYHALNVRALPPVDIPYRSEGNWTVQAASPDQPLVLDAMWRLQCLPCARDVHAFPHRMRGFTSVLQCSSVTKRSSTDEVPNGLVALFGGVMLLLFWFE
jgi:hypothetical protein